MTYTVRKHYYDGIMTDYDSTDKKLQTVFCNHKGICRTGRKVRPFYGPMRLGGELLETTGDGNMAVDDMGGECVMQC